MHDICVTLLANGKSFHKTNNNNMVQWERGKNSLYAHIILL